MRAWWREAFAVTVLALQPWLPAVLAGQEAHASGHTTVLNRTSFDSFLKAEQDKGRSCIVMFHVSWCKVCQRTFPKFAAASDQVHAIGGRMDFAHVDCTNGDKSLCQRFDVKGYPTIKLFQPVTDREPLSYRGQRTEEAFVQYAERMTQPPIRTLKSAEELGRALRKETLATFIAVGGGGSQHPAGLLAAAERWQDLHIFTASKHLQEVLPKAIKAPADASLAVLSPSSQQWPGADNASQPAPVAAFYTSSLDDVAAVTKWVEQNRFPGIWNLDQKNFYFFTHSSRSTALLALDPANTSREREQAVRDAAAKLKDEYIFGVVDAVAWAEELTDFNIAVNSLPRLLVTESDLEIWIEDIEALRVENLEQDLQSLASGVPLLRQDRGFWSKVLFQKREAWRFARRMRDFAARGPLQAALVFAGCLAALALLAAACWCAVTCCQLLLAEDPEFEGHQMADARMKRD